MYLVKLPERSLPLSVQEGESLRLRLDAGASLPEWLTEFLMAHPTAELESLLCRP